MPLNTEIKFRTAVTDEALDQLTVSVSLFLSFPSLNSIYFPIKMHYLFANKYVSFILE